VRSGLPSWSLPPPADSTCFSLSQSYATFFTDGGAAIISQAASGGSDLLSGFALLAATRRRCCFGLMGAGPIFFPVIHCLRSSELMLPAAINSDQTSASDGRYGSNPESSANPSMSGLPVRTVQPLGRADHSVPAHLSVSTVGPAATRHVNSAERPMTGCDARQGGTLDACFGAVEDLPRAPYRDFHKDR
jgi:hypothetical protein